MEGIRTGLRASQFMGNVSHSALMKQMPSRQMQRAAPSDAMSWPFSWHVWMPVILSIAASLSWLLAWTTMFSAPAGRAPWRGFFSWEWIAFFIVAAMVVEALMPPPQKDINLLYLGNIVQAGGWVGGLVVHTLCACQLWIVALQTAIRYADTIVKIRRVSWPGLLVGLLLGLSTLPASCVPVAESIAVSAYGSYWADVELLWNQSSTRKTTLHNSALELREIYKAMVCVQFVSICLLRCLTVPKLLTWAIIVEKRTGVIMSVVLGGVSMVMYIILMTKPGWVSVCADLLGFILGAWGMCTGFIKGANQQALGFLMQVVIVCMVLRYGMPYAGMVSNDNPWFTVTLNVAAAVAGGVSSFV